MAPIAYMTDANSFVRYTNPSVFLLPWFVLAVLPPTIPLWHVGEFPVPAVMPGFFLHVLSLLFSPDTCSDSVFPYRLLIRDRCWQAGRGPPGLREEWVSAASAANKGSVPLGSPAVAASLDLSWTGCSLSRGWNAGEAAKSRTQSGDCTLLQTAHPWKLPREAFSHGVSRSHSHEC